MEGQFKENLLNNTRIICFSELYDSMLMWSHYAKYHQGFCIEYETPDYSDDNARTWHIVYTFKAGQINHIHGLFFDQYTSRIWVATGDRQNECIIGYTEDEFKSFVEVFRGGQEYRTCLMFFYYDFIVFATDSQYIPNKIKRFDRNTLEIIELQNIQGSAIKGGQMGDVSFLSTTIEPSPAPH